MFCFVSAFLSAFLDALTVTAVLIAVAVGFYRIFHLANSGLEFSETSHNYQDDTSLTESGLEDLDNFKAFLRDLMSVSSAPFFKSNSNLRPLILPMN